MQTPLGLVPKSNITIITTNTNISKVKIRNNMMNKTDSQDAKSEN